MQPYLGRQLRPAGGRAAALPLVRHGSRRWKPAMAFLDDIKESGTHHGHRPMPMSLFMPYHQLPPEGEQVLHPADQSCDPAVQKCKTLVYVYEAKCANCSGTGFVKSQSRGRRPSLSTCLLCHGLGYVRHTTTRFVTPDENRESDGVFTINRPTPDTDPAALKAARLRRKPGKQEEPPR